MHKSVSCLAGLMAAWSAAAQSYSVWLPAPKELVVSPGYVHGTFSEYWGGREKADLAGEFRQHKALFSLEYGLSEKVALDLRAGYVWRSIEDDSDNGVADTAFGARYRWIDEETIILPYVPSVGVRVGGIVEGTYDENFPFGEGDGASGAEVSLLLGKAIGSHFGWFGDVGYRYRNHDVPDEFLASTGVYATYKFVTAHVGYRHVQSLSGRDIGEAPFPELKEINQTFETGLGFTEGKRYYQLFYARTLHGRNTGAKDIFGVAVGFGF